MEKQNLDRLLLKTGFSCMACDGHVDDREVELIHILSQQKRMFGDLDTKVELEKLVDSINSQGTGFLKDYLKELSQAHLSKQEQLKVISTSIGTIEADEKIEYSEIKFFKILRSKLDISDEEILKEYPEFEEYLEEDIISETYLSTLQDDFFGNFGTVTFSNIQIKDLD